MNDSGKATVKGDGSNLIKGDGNFINSGTINYFPAVELRPLSKTLTYELLKVFLNSQTPANSEYSLRLPAQINEKLEYNNAPIHVELYENHSEDLACIDDVIAGFPDSETIIRKLRDIFIKMAPRSKDGRIVGNGDECLDNIEKEVLNVVQKDKDYDPQLCSLENLERFCSALVAYGVSKCKVLENPNDDAPSRSK